MGTITYLTVFRFSIQLIISEAAFLAIRPRKDHFVTRAILGLAIILGLSYIWFGLLSSLSKESIWLCALFYLGVTGFSVIGLLFCFDVMPMEMLFICTCGYATEHITFAATRVIMYLLGISSQSLPMWADYLFVRLGNYILIAFIMYKFVVKKYADYETFTDKISFRFIPLAIVVMLTAIVLSVWYTNAESTPELMLYTHLLCPIYSSLCCLLIIIMEYYTFNETRAVLETEQMEQMLQMAEAQRISNKEAIDIINVRCHDLKHQMKALTGLHKDDTSTGISEYMESIKRATSIYDATYHTGNEALDYILREKSLLAEEKDIEFSCMADGNAISFMQQVDIYALMGNALDNALEQLEKEDKDGRILSLQIQERAGIVIIRLENTCTSKITFQNGLPVTSKGDFSSHGFGVRSIKYVVQKYDGDLIIESKNNRFILSIAIPKKFQ